MRKAGCLALVVGLVAILILFAVIRSWGGAGPAPRTLTFQVAKGASVASTARDLERAGAIASASRFRLLARAFGSGDPIKAGEYRIPAHTSPSDILKLLQGGKVLQRLVVVPEGYPSVLVHQAVARADGLTGPVGVPAEGSILPDSYAFERGDTRAALVSPRSNA